MHGPRDLFTMACLRLDELLRPESCVIYAESGPAYGAVFERGPALPAAFRSSGSLVETLKKRDAPLSLNRVAGQLRDEFLDDLDRAALDGLAAAVVLPIRHGDDLAAFQCLGEKRSGDVYTSADIALLGAIAEKLAASLQHFDEAALYDQARESKERAAVESAREIVKGVAKMRLADGATLSAGVGISTGPAFVGNIRAVDRLIWSAIGNTTNLAARFQSLTRDLEASIVVDAITFARAGTMAATGFESRGAVPIRGCRESKEVYSLGIDAERDVT